MPSDSPARDGILNWREIDALLDEIHLDGTRLRKVRQPDYRGIILEFSSPDDPSALALIMAPPYPRLHLLTPGRKLPRALPKPPRFTTVLKSRLEGARLSSLSQLGQDRIVRFTFQRAKEELNLDVKLWGNSANIILCGSDGIIIDTYSRRPKRGEAPGETWPPPGIGTGVKEGSERFSIRNLPGKGSWNQRVEEYFRKLDSAESTKNRKELWEFYLNRREAALKIREERIRKGEERFRNQLKDGHHADIIMAYLHELKKGDVILEAEDWESPGTPCRIPLNPELTPRENAERYYNRQKRALRGLERLEEDRNLLISTRNHIEELRRQETFDTDPPDHQTKKGQARGSLPGLWINRPPFIIAVGRSAKESDTLLRHWARGNDLWLHVRDTPGSHVFIRVPRGKTVPLEILLDAGNLALSYSKSKTAGEADLYYTRVKHLRRVKQGNARISKEKTATVIPTHEKNLHIRMDNRRLESLKEAAELS
jgi:predicted ribosome quality control (RQC) complex YloA/Tae2 family protein